MSSSVSSGPITFTFTNSVKNAQWIVSQWSGVDTSGVNGSGAIAGSLSSARNNITDTSYWNPYTLGTFLNTNNVNYSVFGMNASTAVVIPGAGFTEIDERSSGESSATSNLEAEWAVNKPNISASWGITLNVGYVAIQLKAMSASSLGPSAKNLSAISQMINSLDEILKQLSQILK